MWFILWRLISHISTENKIFIDQSNNSLISVGHVSRVDFKRYEMCIRSDAGKADIPDDVRGRFTASRGELRLAQMQNHLCEFYSMHLRRRDGSGRCASRDRSLSSNMDPPSELVHRIATATGIVARELERPEAIRGDRSGWLHLPSDFNETLE